MFAPSRPAQAPAVPAPAPRIALLDVDDDLAAGLPRDQLDFARRVLAAPQVQLASGPWVPRERDLPEALLGFLVVEGLLRQDTVLAGNRAAQLHGPGDVADPFAPAADGAPVQRSWTAVGPTRLAALDTRFLAATCRWPTIGLALHRKMAAQAARLTVHAAATQLGRVELRLLAVLWELADRWGVVTPDGVSVRLRLTHQALGDLVGARRPTVTLALRELADQGHVSRDEDGCFLLAVGSREALAGAD